MTSSRVQTKLAWFVGVLFIVMGIAEVVVRLVSSEPIDPDAIAFWFLSLSGGGTLVLLGSFVVTRPRWLPVTLVLIGCVAGIVATMWTLVIPLFVLALLFLTVRNADAGADHEDPEPTPAGP